MKSAITKTEIESAISSRFSSAFKPQEKRPGEFLSSGISEIDSLAGGLPRGAITEIYGPASSGRTSFMLSAMAQATKQDEVCALVDLSNVFDPQSAAAAKVKFDRLLWIRCASQLENAFKATDMLLQAGGFGLVMLDLGDVPAKSAKRIISSWWYRFRRTLAATPTALVVIVEESAVRSCAALALELKTENCLWSGSGRTESTSVLNSPLPRSHGVTPMSAALVARLRRQRTQTLFPHANLLQGLAFQVECRRPLYLRQEVSCKASF
jgi:recA bacterial DNA recombination protein